MPMAGNVFLGPRGLGDSIRNEGTWLVLTGHDIGSSDPVSTRIAMLEDLVPCQEAEETESGSRPSGKVHTTSPRPVPLQVGAAGAAPAGRTGFE